MSNELMNKEATNLTIDETEDKVTITGTLAVDAFIIPNSPTRINDLFMDSAKLDILQLAIDNHQILEPANDKIVNLWLVSEEGDNLSDHGLTVTSGDKEYYLPYFGDTFDNIPAHFFEGLCEGENLNLKVTRWGRKVNDKETEVDITVKMCLAQSKYRYRRFGDFQDVLYKLTGIK
jgi:hypothetical protein